MFSFKLKEKGVIPDSTRDMINDLVALDGVCLNKVIGMLKRIAGKLGFEVMGNISDHSNTMYCERRQCDVLHAIC